MPSRGADGRIECPPTCGLALVPTTRYTLTAEPDAVSFVAGWHGCDVGTTTTCTFDMPATDLNVTVAFDLVGGPPTPLPEPVPGASPPETPPPSAPPSAIAPSRCTIVGTSGDDELTGTSRRDVICGLGGDDHIHAGNGNDVVLGGGATTSWRRAPDRTGSRADVVATACTARREQTRSWAAPVGTFSAAEGAATRSERGTASATSLSAGRVATGRARTPSTAFARSSAGPSDDVRPRRFVRLDATQRIV